MFFGCLEKIASAAVVDIVAYPGWVQTSQNEAGGGCVANSAAQSRYSHGDGGCPLAGLVGYDNLLLVTKDCVVEGIDGSAVHGDDDLVELVDFVSQEFIWVEGFPPDRE